MRAASAPSSDARAGPGARRASSNVSPRRYISDSLQIPLTGPERRRRAAPSPALRAGRRLPGLRVARQPVDRLRQQPPLPEEDVPGGLVPGQGRPPDLAALDDVEREDRRRVVLRGGP